MMSGDEFCHYLLHREIALPRIPRERLIPQAPGVPDIE